MTIVAAADPFGHTESTALQCHSAMNNGLLGQLISNTPRFDGTDLRIIGELAEDGRVSLAELGRRVSLSAPAVAERVKRLERAGVVTGYRAEVDLRKLGYQLTAIVRIKPSPGQLPRIPQLAEQIPEVGECHRITGEDCFYLKVHLRSIDELSGLLDRFLVYGQTTTSIVNETPIPDRLPPLGEE
jgi:Lrp/AsnC family transcriptional regulator, leucine-responsive regulatory protein